MCSLRNERYRNATELSKCFWNLNEQKIDCDQMAKSPACKFIFKHEQKMQKHF